MACEKYSSLITDKALGGLNPERKAELREHLSQCAACREEFDYAKAACAAMDRGVDALVAGEPSPQFVIHLRARIANDRPQSHIKWRVWVPVAAGALAVASLVLFVIRPPLPQNVNPRPASIAVSHSSSFASTGAEPSPQQSALNRLPEHAARQTLHSNAPAHPAAHPQEPQVLIAPGQLVAVMRFANAVNAGRINRGQIVAVQLQSNRLIEIEPIQIPPLSIANVGDPSESSGNTGSF